MRGRPGQDEKRNKQLQMGVRRESVCVVSCASPNVLGGEQQRGTW